MGRYSSGVYIGNTVVVSACGDTVVVSMYMGRNSSGIYIGNTVVESTWRGPVVECAWLNTVVVSTWSQLSFNLDNGQVPGPRYPSTLTMGKYRVPGTLQP